MRQIWLCVVAFVLLATTGVATAQLSDDEKLGKDLFFDEALSTPPGEACAACHGTSVGFTGPESDINAAGAVYPGAVHTRFGNRKPPSAAYGGDSPVLNQDGGDFTGGMFWDGRATGLKLGDPLAEQAQGPFLNPLEQNNPNAKTVVDKVLKSDYKSLFVNVCGKKYDVNKYYVCIARSIAAYERSSEVSSFTSKFDKYLANDNQDMLTKEEQRGYDLFKANCDGCHPSSGTKPLFTDFTYDNIGVPKNPKNPFYDMPTKFNPVGDNFIDPGLGGFLKGFMPIYADQNYGKFKVPTLRNVAKGSCEAEPDNPKCITKAYSHNGFFKSLKEIVHFYNTRDVPEADWPAPETTKNLNKEELGNLGLSSQDESDIVAFLETLSDK